MELLLHKGDVRALRGAEGGEDDIAGETRGVDRRGEKGDRGQPRACGRAGGGIGLAWWLKIQGDGRPLAGSHHTPSFSTLPEHARCLDIKTPNMREHPAKLYA